ncbi:hypothetical protein D3C81_478240 [compost metagenome]
MTGLLAIEVHVEAAVGLLLQLPVGILAETFLFAPAAARQHALQRGLIAIEDEAANAGHGAHQVVKLRLDRVQIGEDVGVIVFQVVHDGSLRVVVHEFAALVEEGRVVLIGFDDEEVRIGALAINLAAEAGGNAKVHRHAADQKARCIAGVFEYPRQHGRGGGLAMRAGHGQYPLVA